MISKLHIHGVRSITVEERHDYEDGGGDRILVFEAANGSKFRLKLFADQADALRIEGDAPREHRVPATEAPYGLDADALRNDEILERIRQGKA